MARAFVLVSCAGLFAIATTFAVHGCGGDEEPTGGTGGNGASGAVGGTGGIGGAESGVSVTFFVGETHNYETDHAPIEGATVAFDAPGGERVELTTGADGKVTFEAVDWSLGTATVTAYRDGYAMYSLVDLDADKVASLPLVDGGVFLWLIDPTPDEVETVTISGTVTGVQDAAHQVVVNVVHGETGDEWTGPSSGTFSVSVPSGQPFTLQAFEMTQQYTSSGQGYDMPIYQVSHQDFDATSDDVSGLVLDLATGSMVTHTADVSWSTPARAESPVRTGFGIGLVCPVGSFYCSGWSTHMDISANGDQFDNALLWVEPTWANTPIFFARVFDGNNELSFRRSIGWPQDGFVGVLPDTPEWLTPPAGAQHPLHEPLTWQLFDSDVPSVTLRITKGQTITWVVDAGANATTVTVPELPSTVDSATVLGLAPRAFILAGWPNDELWSYDAYGVSKTIFLTP